MAICDNCKKEAVVTIEPVVKTIVPAENNIRAMAKIFLCLDCLREFAVQYPCGLSDSNGNYGENVNVIRLDGKEA